MRTKIIHSLKKAIKLGRLIVLTHFFSLGIILRKWVM